MPISLFSLSDDIYFMKRTQVPILMYHALDPHRSIIAIPPAVFAWQMRWLYENNYNVISLSRLVQDLRTGRPLPPRSIVITFDDGFESIYKDAFPVLVKYGFPATVFLVTGFCGQQNDWPHQPTLVPRRLLLTWSQVREMDRHRIEFGAHTVSHPWLDKIPANLVEHEIMASKTHIEEQVGHSIELFAYPYGRYNDTIKKVVSRIYTGACTTRLGMINSGDDPLALDRIEVLYLAQHSLFRGLSSSVFPLYLTFRRLLRNMAFMVFNRTWK